MKKRLMILDGSSLFFRAFYALPLLTAPTGEYTNAIFGFANMMVKMISDYKPDKMVVAFDKSRHTFRTELFADYKGTRDKTPDEFKAQVPLLRDFLECFGVPFIEIDEFEADDIIGTLATKAAADGGYEVFIVTGDRDELQLVRDGVSVLFTRRGISEIELFDEAAFRAKYGFAPIRLIDLKGLMGDTSDNIPGVPGVGEKTATKLLLAYESLEGVYEHIDEVAGKKLKEKLQDNKKLAELSKKLATIVTDAPVEFTPDEYDVKPDAAKIKAYCSRYDLKAVQRNIEKIIGEPVLDFGAPLTEEGTSSFSAREIKTKADFEAFANEARRNERFAFSCEFAGNAPHRSVKSIGLCAADDCAYVLPTSEAWGDVIAFINDGSNTIERATIDLKNWYQAGGNGDVKYFDIMVAAYLIDPTLGSKDVAHLSGMWLTDVPKLNDTAEPVKRAWQAMMADRLVPIMREKMNDGLKRLYDDIEFPLIRVLSDMETMGIYVNRAKLEQQGVVVGDTIEHLEADIYGLAGHEFNINSTKQMGEVLFDEIGLKPLKKTKSGKYSTNVEVLESLQGEHPIIEKILAYRMWTKLKSTYIDAIDGLIDGDTKRVHTTFNQTVTATGRLSSSDPNLQNIPVRTEEGKMIRSFFEPGDGYDYLLSADYSQIELRVLAHISGYSAFIDAFQHNEDVHARTASEVFGVPIDEVTPLQRRHAKAVNFGIVYGISDFGLSKSLGITRKEAARYIDSYFEKYPGVKSFIDKVVADAHENGGVTTMFGRRRDLPAIKSKNFNQRSLAERMAMNTPIQGTAADIIKLAMIRVDRMIKEAGLKSRVLLQVHDELVLEVVTEEIDAVKKLLREAMEHVVELRVPLVIDINIGKNWAEAK